MNNLNTDIEDHVFGHLHEDIHKHFFETLFEESLAARRLIRRIPNESKSEGYIYLLDRHHFPIKNLLTEIK
jgi:hypothetical protein